MNQLRPRLSAFRLDATTTIGAVFLAFGLGVVLGGYLMTVAATEKSIFTFIKETYSNFGIEMVSIALTVIVIDRLNRRRDEQRTERELKAQLVRDARSKVPDVAVNAVHQMMERDWLRGETGLLRGAHLIGAHLSGANLEFANLSGAELLEANLSGAGLFEANLSGAKLPKANLSGTILSRANLSDTDLWWANLSDTNLNGANLSGAKLWGANLSGAKLVRANLSGATLSDATLDEATTLPDGTLWTSDTDMKRFTDPQHPNFWRSDDPHSPAWRGKAAPPTPGGGQP